MVSNSKGGICNNKRLENTAKYLHGFSDHSHKSEKCRKTFAKVAKFFYGFFESNADSENYFRRFERFRKSYYNPVVVLERLPESVFHSGKVSKRIHVNVKAQRTALMKGSRIPGCCVENEPVNVQPQHCTKNNHHEAREGKRERIQTEGASDCKSQREKSDETDSRRGRSRRKAKSADEVENQHLDYCSLKEKNLKERKKRTFTAVRDILPKEVTVEKKKNIQDRCSAKCEVHFGNTVCTKHTEGCPQKCLQTLEPSSFTADGTLEQNVSPDIFKPHKMGIQARRPSFKCLIPVEAVGTEEDPMLNEQCTKSVAQLEDVKGDVKNVRAGYRAKSCDKCTLEVDAHTLKNGSSDVSECNSSCMDVADLVQNALDEVAVEKEEIFHIRCLLKSKYEQDDKVDCPSKCARRYLKHAKTSELVDESQLIKFEKPQRCREGIKPVSPYAQVKRCSPSTGFGDSVEQVPDEAKVEKAQKCQPQSCTKSQTVRDRVNWLTKRGWRHTRLSGSSEGDSCLLKVEVRSRQKFKDGSKLYSSSGEIDCHRLCGCSDSSNLDDLMEKVPRDGISAVADKSQSCQEFSHPKCKVHLENEFETNLPQGGLTRLDDGTVEAASLQIISDNAMKCNHTPEYDPSSGNIASMGSSVDQTCSVQRHKVIVPESQHENKGETKHPSDSPCKSGMVKPHVMMLDNSQNNCGNSGDECPFSLTADSDSVLKGLDELVVRDKKSVHAQPSLECKIPCRAQLDPFVSEKENTVQGQCCEKSGIKLDTNRATSSPHCEEQLTISTSKSVHQKESNYDLVVDEFGIKVCFSEECHWNKKWAILLAKPTLKSMDPKKPKNNRIGKVGNKVCLSQKCPWKKLCEMLKPCVVRLERIPDLDKAVKRTVKQDDSVHYPIVTKAGPRKIADERMFRCSLPSGRNAGVMSILPKKKMVPPVSNIEGPPIVDLSDGLALKKFCELKSISLVDSDDETHDRVIKDRGPLVTKKAIIIPDSEDESNVDVIQDCESSTVLSQVNENCVSSRIHPNPDVDFLHSVLTVEGPDLSADSVVSVNPVHRGVQAMNELGFLDNEAFQLGKEQPSENIWSDVLDFGEADELEMEGISTLRDRDLLPLLSEDFIPCLDSEKPVEVGSISGKVTISTGLHESGLETINIKSKIQEDRADKEYLVNDPLISDEHLEEPNVEISKSIPWNNMGESEFLASLIRPKKMSSDVSQQLGGKEKVEEERKSELVRGFRNISNDVAEIGLTQDDSLLIAESKKFNSVSKKCKSHDHANKNDCFGDLKADRDSRELEYRTRLRWMTQNVKADEDENDECVDNEAKSNGIKAEAKEDIPTSEKLYRDLSTIPYVVKCNLQNRCRKCKNLNPCANANKKFKLFWTLTVGFGRRLSKPLMETFQNPGDPCVINRTTAYIAASAVKTRLTTILVPALPETVQKVLPLYHSNLLMQLVEQTIEMEKKEKRSNSDMAIAETLQFKRARIAMKARIPSSGNQVLPQSKQTKPNSLIAQSVLSGRPVSFKSDKIIAVKSKVDSKFRFVKKSLVSILPKDSYKGAGKTEEAVDDKNSCVLTHNKLGDEDARLELRDRSPPEKRSKLSPECGEIADGSCALIPTIPASTVRRAAIDPAISDVIGAHQSAVVSCDILSSSSNHLNNIGPPLIRSRTSSINSDQNHIQSIEPALKKRVLDSPYDDNFNSNVCSEIQRHTNAPLALNERADKTISSKSVRTKVISFESGMVQMGDIRFQKSRKTQKSDTNNASLNKVNPCQPVGVSIGSRDDFHASLSCPSFSSIGVCSMGVEESGYGSAENEANLDSSKTERTTRSANLLPGSSDDETGKTNEMIASKERQAVAVLAVCSQVTPDIAPSENQFPKKDPFASTQRNEVDPESNVSMQISADPKLSGDLPDLILVPDEVESIDLTTGEEEMIDLANEPFPKWGVICSSLPELGFVRVQKRDGKLLLSDKSVVSDPLTFNSVWELNTFLNSQLAELTYSQQSKMALQWILVTSGYLAVKNMPPTNPEFWLHPSSTRKTHENVRVSDKQFDSPQKNTTSQLATSRVIPAKGGQSNPTATFKCILGSAGKESRRFRFVGNNGKIIRINGHTVVLGTTAKVTKKQMKAVDKAVPTTPQASEMKCAVSVSGTVPQYMILPGSISPSGRTTKYVLTPSQTVTLNPVVSSAPRSVSTAPSVPASRMRVATTVHARSVPAASGGLILPAPGMQQIEKTVAHRTQTIPIPRKDQTNQSCVPVSAFGGQNPILTLPRLQWPNTPCVPLVPAASLTTPASSTPIRGQLKQIVVTPSSVTCVTLASSTPSSHVSTGLSSSTPLSTALVQKKLVPIAPKENPPHSHRPILILRKSSSLPGSPTPRKFVFQKP